MALYTFEEAAGTTVRDVSGAGARLDLTVLDGAAVSWIPGGGLSIDASTAVVSSGSATKLFDGVQSSQELSIEAWVKPSSVTQFGPARIVAMSVDPSTNGANFILGQGVNATSSDTYDVRLRTTTTTNFGTPSLTSPGGALTMDLTHVVYTRASTGEARLYVNGALVESGVSAGTLASWNPGYVLSLANEPTVDRPWLGELHLVALYARALDAGEVDLNFQAGPAGPGRHCLRMQASTKW